MLSYLFTDNPEYKNLGKFLSILVAILSFFIAFSNFFQTLSNEWLLFPAILFISMSLYMIDNLNPIIHFLIVLLLMFVLYLIDDNNTSSGVMGSWVLLLTSVLFLLLFTICFQRLQNHRSILMTTIITLSIISSIVLIYFSIAAINN